MSEQEERPTVSLVPALREPSVTYGALDSMRETIRNVIAPKSTDDELTFFFKVCEAVQLDPFKKQIYLIPRWDKRANGGKGADVHQPQAAIDGFRAIAHRTGEYEGQLGPLWCARERDEGGQPIWVDVWLSRETLPAAAKVGVLRKGFKEPLWAVAIFEEYVQTKTYDNGNTVRLGMWDKMPANQLAKCAEALALRRAFPEETAGLVTVDEVVSEYDDGLEAQQERPQPVAIDTNAALASDVNQDAEREDVVQPPAPNGAAADDKEPGGGGAAAPSPGPTADGAPWEGYDGQNVRFVVSKLDSVEDADQLRAVAAYEAATKNRAGVLTKCEYRLAEVGAVAARDDVEEGAAPTVTPLPAAEHPPPTAPFPAPAPAPVELDELPPEPPAAELSPSERLERACELTHERFPDYPGWDPVKVLAQAAELWERKVDSFSDLQPDEVESIWSAVPEEIKEELGYASTGA